MSKIYYLKQARKPRSYASPKLRPTQRLTGVKCRATSVSKKISSSGQSRGTPSPPSPSSSPLPPSVIKKIIRRGSGQSRGTGSRSDSDHLSSSAPICTRLLFALKQQEIHQDRKRNNKVQNQKYRSIQLELTFSFVMFWVGIFPKHCQESSVSQFLSV